jgi:transposase-like protein
MVRGAVEETLNALLDAEADEMYKAQRYEHSPDRVDTYVGQPHQVSGTLVCYRISMHEGPSWV